MHCGYLVYRIQINFGFLISFLCYVNCDLMPLSHYGWYIPWLEILLCGGTAPRSPHLVRVVHTTGGEPLLGHTSLTINNSRITVLQTLVTEKQPPLTSTHLRQPSDQHVPKRPIPLLNLMSLYYNERRPNHNLKYTVDHTFSYRSKKFINACAKSSVHAHITEIRDRNFKHFKTSIE